MPQYSSTILEFFAYLRSFNRRFIPSDQVFIPQSLDKKLKKTINDNLSNIFELFSIEINNQTERYGGRYEVELIRDLYDYTDSEHNSIFVGGFPALMSAYLQSDFLRKNPLINKKKSPIYILPENFSDSASFGNSLQFHVSHATPMYTDPEFSTFNIIYSTLRRSILNNDSPERDNYMIAEILLSSLLNKDVLKVGLSYLYHELNYKVKSMFNLNTIINQNIPLAIFSGHIMDKIGQDLNTELLLRKNTLRLAYNNKETIEMQKLTKILQSHGVGHKIINDDEIFNVLGAKPKTLNNGSIWSIIGDGYLTPAFIDIIIQSFKANGGKVIQGTLTHIVYDDNAKGVIINSGKKQQYLKSNKIFTSLGPYTKYLQPDDIKSFNPVERIIQATGYSAYLLVQGHIKVPIDTNNSHFTPLQTFAAEGEIYTLVKTTCGGSIGSDGYCIDHAINNLFYATNIVYPGHKVEILYAKSCNRSINGQNSSKLTEIIPGFYAGTGFGGKGITEGAGFALEHVLPKINSNLSAEIMFDFVNSYKR